MTTRRRVGRVAEFVLAAVGLWLIGNILLCSLFGVTIPPGMSSCASNDHCTGVVGIERQLCEEEFQREQRRALY